MVHLKVNKPYLFSLSTEVISFSDFVVFNFVPRFTNVIASKTLSFEKLCSVGGLNCLKDYR